MSDQDLETPDEDEENEENEDESEPEPEQTPAEAAKQDGSDAILKAAGKATQDYHKRLEKILGPDEARHECPTCEGKGIVWGAVEEAPEPVHPDNLVRCEKCNGYGEVITGSLHPDHRTAICITCAGNGFVTKHDVPQNVSYMPPASQPVTAQQAQMGTMQPDGTFVPFYAPTGTP